MLPVTVKETPIRCYPVSSENERNTHEHGPLQSNEIPNIGRHLLSDTVLGSLGWHADCESTTGKEDVQSSGVQAYMRPLPHFNNITKLNMQYPHCLTRKRRL